MNKIQKIMQTLILKRMILNPETEEHRSGALNYLQRAYDAMSNYEKGRNEQTFKKLKKVRNEIDGLLIKKAIKVLIESYGLKDEIKKITQGIKDFKIISFKLDSVVNEWGCNVLESQNTHSEKIIEIVDGEVRMGLFDIVNILYPVIYKSEEHQKLTKNASKLLHSTLRGRMRTPVDEKGLDWAFTNIIVRNRRESRSFGERLSNQFGVSEKKPTTTPCRSIGYYGLDD